MDSHENKGNVQRIQLEPFKHQVGGHSSMFIINNDTVCKPLIERELKFYESIPKTLKNFLPKFKGVIKVTIYEENNGLINVFANVSGRDPVEIKRTKQQSRFRIFDNDEVEIESDNPMLFENVDADSALCTHNPWVFRCHRNNLYKFLTKQKLDVRDHYQNTEFIILENLTSRYHHPCVLDLKMGVRHYGDDASLSKIKSQEAKVENTTSSKIGLRISGMQVVIKGMFSSSWNIWLQSYRVTTGNYLCKDKYFGRSLSVNGFKNAVYDFLFNGLELRYDVLRLLIRKLQHLKEVIVKLDSFRFFSSSLLILYEGCDKSQLAVDRCDKCRVLSSQRVNNDKEMCKEICQQQFGEGSTSSQNETDTDVRIIDFAHSTHNNLDDPTSYNGPDSGFMFGLDSLITVLLSLDKP